MSHAKGAGRPAGDATSSAPRAWWQWLLIYPGLALGLLGSIPTLVQAFESLRFDVPYRAVPLARESHAMFERNLDCLDLLASSEHVVRLPDNTAIHALACRTGDIMIRVDRPDGRSTIRWLEGKSLMASAGTPPGLIGSAAAADAMRQLATGDQPVAVICTKRQRDGTVVRRMRLASGACIDEVINSYTGAVVAVRPAPCTC